jgi:methionyl-tRNA formyltransferase
MKIVYMGTPEFAVPALDALAAAGHEIPLVLAKPDMPRDRGKKLQACPVKARALELGLEVETPERLKGDKSIEEKLRTLAPDLIVVAAYGMLLPKAILDIPRLGCINIHGSLLPEYRGAAPIQRAILEGKEELGVTLMYMEEALDAGDMIAKASTPADDKTSDELFLELAQLGAELLMEQLPLIEAGRAERIPQDDSRASWAPRIEKEDGKIDFSEPARAVYCRVKAMNSWPSAYCSLGDRVMKVHKARLLTPSEEQELPGLLENAAKLQNAASPAPGTVLKADKKGLVIACGEGEAAVFTNIQLPGKKAMDVSAFLLGNKIEIGTVLC